MFPVRHQDARLAPKEWIAGVLIDGQPKAYPLKHLSSGHALEDRVGGQTLHIMYDANARSVQVTNANKHEVPVVQAYWFAWAAFYPGTEVYEP